MSTKRKIAEEINLSEYISQHGFNVGFKVPAGSYVKVLGFTGDSNDDDEETPPPPSIGFHITKVCLGPEAAPNERAVLTFIDGAAEKEKEIVCASLSVGGTENDILDLVLEGDFLLGNPNTRATAIHILGRITSTGGDNEDGDYEDDLEDDDDDDEGEAGIVFDDENDEDDEEDEEDDEDDYLRKSTVKIEQVPSDDESEDAPKPSSNGPAATNGVKRAKLEQQDKKVAAATSSKKADVKAVTTPAANSKKSAESKAEAKTPAASEDGKKPVAKKSSDAQVSASKEEAASDVTADIVLEFIKSQLKVNKELQGTALGTAIASKFGKGLKAMGFEEKTLSKFVDVHAKGEVVVTESGSYKLN